MRHLISRLIRRLIHWLIHWPIHRQTFAAMTFRHDGS